MFHILVSHLPITICVLFVRFHRYHIPFSMSDRSSFTYSYRCIFLLTTRWLPVFARVPYYSPSPCHMHTVHNCHHITSFHPPVKQYITTHHNTDYTRLQFCICNINVAMARAALCVVLCGVYCIHTSVLLRVPPLKFTSLPIFIPPALLTCSSPSLRCSLPPPLAPTPLFPSLRPSSLVPYFTLLPLPRLPLPPSLTSWLPHSLPLIPPSLPPPPSRCSLPHPPSILAPSLPPPCLLPVVQFNVHLVCLASCIVFCSA